jgi:hypothetical protein
VWHLLLSRLCKGVGAIDQAAEHGIRDPTVAAAEGEWIFFIVVLATGVL